MNTKTLPPSLTSLSFNGHFGQKYSKELCYLPISLTRVSFGKHFNQPINTSSLHHTLEFTRLTFRLIFNKSRVDYFSSLNCLLFGQEFNQTIDSLGQRFTQPIKVLPPRLTHLDFGTYFNQSVDGYLPSTLVELIFVFVFNHPINIIPPSLETLQLGASYTCKRSHLYSSVLSLSFWYF